VSSLAFAATDVGDGCPPGGYERLGCDLDRGRAELCGPNCLFDVSGCTR
jgi:hypothetical protein